MPISDDMPFSPTPNGNASAGAFFQAVVFDVLMRLNVAKPATVVKWSPPVQGQLPACVDLQIDFKRVRAIDNVGDLLAGETLSVETAGLRAVGLWPVIPNVPVVQWGPPSFQWRGAVPVGTTGVLLLADAVLDQWKSRGGPLDPGLPERHGLNCGIFFPTLYHGANTPTIDPLVDVLGPNDGSAGFEIATGTDKSVRVFTTGPNATIDASALVDLGAGASLGVARLTDDVTATADMATFMAQVVTALTTIAAAVPVAIVPPVPPGGPIGTISSASSKVRAE